MNGIVGKQIFELRKERGMTQSDLGRMLNVKKTTVCSWEHGNSSPNDLLKTRICEIFGIDMNTLFGFNTNERN